MGQTHKSITEGAVRIKAVEMYLDRGYSAAVIAKMPHPTVARRQLGTIKTVVADIKQIQKSRVAADPDFFTRVSVVRSTASAVYARIMEDVELTIAAERRRDDPSNSVIGALLMNKAKITELWLEANLINEPDKVLIELAALRINEALRKIQSSARADKGGGTGTYRKPSRTALPASPT